MLQIYPHAQPVTMPIYHPLELPTLPERPYTLVNMAGSMDGKAVIEGEVNHIGNATDQKIMRILRAQVDAVCCGAGTLRAHNINFKILPELAEVRRQRGLKDQLWGVCWSDRLNLPLDNKFFNDPEHRSIVVTARAADEAKKREVRERCEVLEIGDEHIDFAEAMHVLKSDFGVNTLLSEGGPNLNYPMLQQRLLDEFFLTLSPKVVGGKDTLTLVEGPGEGFTLAEVPEFDLVSVFHEDDLLYLRYRRK